MSCIRVSRISLKKPMRIFKIEDLIDEKMNEKGIDIPIYMFREVIREKGEGWDIVQIKIGGHRYGS